MKDSKLVNDLKQLSANELRLLGDFVASPYHCKDEHMPRFLEAVVETNFESDKLDRQQIFKKVYPTKTYKDQQFYELNSSLYRLLEEFLVAQKLRKSQRENSVLLLEALSEGKMERAFRIKHTAWHKEVESSDVRDEDYYLNQYRAESAGDDLFMRLELRSADDKLKQKMDHLDHFYFAAKLRTACEMHNRANIIEADYEQRFTDQVIAIIEGHAEYFRSITAVWAYYLIYKMLTTDEEIHFRALRELLTTQSQCFSKSEARGLFQHALNFCIRRINRAQAGWLEEIFGVYQLQLSKGLLVEGKFVNQWNYKNIITVGLRLKEYDWTHDFLQKQRELLAPEYRENAFNYNLANFYYETGDHAKAKKLMQTVEFTDPYYNLATRSLLSRIYFEEDDSEALFAQLEAFRGFLSRNKKISKYQKEVNLNFIRLTKSAQRLRDLKPLRFTEKYGKRVDDLDARIRSKSMVHQKWVLAQVGTLRK